MSNKVRSLQEIQTLIQNIVDEVESILLDTSENSNKYYYQNFTNLSFKCIKYLQQYYNSRSHNQSFGKLIDTLISKFSLSLKQYKSRNIYVHSHIIEQTQDRKDDDQIYHFMNTRNNFIPLECLSSYENDKQRKELQEYVEEMNRQKNIKSKQNKRSLMLPKDSFLDLKIGRKNTYDVGARFQKDQVSKQQPIIEQLPVPVTSEHVETQTDFAFEQSEVQLLVSKKSEIQIASQCESLIPTQIVISNNNLNNNLKNSNNSKKKKKLVNSIQSKKKAKFNSTNPSYLKQNELQKTNNVQIKKKGIRSMQCSLKLVRINDPILTICNKQVDIHIFQADQMTIAINLINNTYLEHHSIPIISNSTINYINQNTNTNINLQNNIEDSNSKNIISVENLGKNLGINTLKSVKELSVSSNKSSHQNSENNNKYKFPKSNTINSSQQHQKISISNLVILQNSNKQAPLLKFQHRNTDMNYNNMKRKRYTGQRHLFQSINFTQIKDDIKYRSNLNGQKILIQPHIIYDDIKNKQRLQKSNYDQDSITSSQNQLYLDSKQYNKLDNVNNNYRQYHQIKNIIQTNQNYNSKIENIKQKINNNKLNYYQNIQQNLISNNQLKQNMIIISNNNKNNKILKQNKFNKYTSNLSSHLFQNNILSHHINLQNQQQKILDNNQDHKYNTQISKNSYYKHSNLTSIAQLTLSQNTKRSNQVDNLGNRFNLTQSIHKNQHEKKLKKTTKSQQKQFYKRSLQKLPKRIKIGEIKNDIKSEHHSKNKYHHHSQSEYLNHHLDPFELTLLKSKLRKRVYLDNLKQYLELIQATHLKFCGKDCLHIKQIKQASPDQASLQLLRLFSRLK